MQRTVRSWSHTQERMGQCDSGDISRPAPSDSASNGSSQTPPVRHSPNVHISPPLRPPSLGGQPPPSHRHPSLSLNITNLRTSTIEFSSPDPSSLSTTNFPENLDYLRIGLDSIWQQSSKIFHGLYQTMTQQSEKIRALTTNNVELQGIVTRQRVMLQDTERQKVQQTRIPSENQAEQTDNKVAWELTKLKTTNARLWEDIMKLEGEKKELKAKLESQAEFVRLCQSQIQEERNKFAKKPNNNSENVKMEESEDVGVDAGRGPIFISLYDVEQRISIRLHAQAIEHSLEINSFRKLLADYQLRTTDLEAQLHSSEVQRSSPSRSPSSDHYQAPGHTNKTTSASRSGLGHISPMVPQTIVSSNSSEPERDYSSNSLEGWNPTDDRFKPNDIHAAPPTHRRASGSAGVETRRILQRRYSTPVITDSVPAQTSARGAPSQKSVEMPPPPPPSSRRTPSTYCGPTIGWRPTPAANSSSQSCSHPSTTRVTSVNSQPLSPTHDSHHQPNQQAFRQQSPIAPSPRFQPQSYSGNDSQSVHLEGRNQSQPTPRSHQNSQEVMQPRNTHSRSPSTANSAERPKKRFRIMDGLETKRSPGSSSPPSLNKIQSSQSHGESEDQIVPQMTLDEQAMFSSLSRVLVRKKEGESWRCALCKLERVNPQATFGEDTPIGGVTNHVKYIHKAFWKEIKQSSPAARRPSPQSDSHPG